jgi:hypothetical protein
VLRVLAPSNESILVIRDSPRRAAPEGSVRSKTLKTKVYPSRRTLEPARLKEKRRGPIK